VLLLSGDGLVDDRVDDCLVYTWLACSNQNVVRG